MSKNVKWGTGADSVSTAATATSLVYTLKPTTMRCAFSYVWTGTTAGTVIPEISLDGINWTALASVTGITDDGAAAPAGSAASLLKVSAVVANYLRFVFTRSGGTGLLSVQVKEVAYN